MAYRRKGSSHLMASEMKDRSCANVENHDEAFLEAGILRDAKDVDEFDPWDLPEVHDFGPKWSELDGLGKAKCVALLSGKVALLLGFLYFFICSIDLLSCGCRLLGGKTAGEAFASNKILSNPVADLMIGFLATVLLQSSSTTTSIVVCMVATEILPVEQAVYMVMGANIGTSVTNTITTVSSALKRHEFHRAFERAVIHDIFNWLSVLMFLAWEVITGYLQHLTGKVIRVLHLEQSKKTNQKLLKVITEPLTKLIIQIDQKIITNMAVENCTSKTAKTIAAKNETIHLTCVLKTVYEVEEKGSFLFAGTPLSDTWVSLILVVVSIVMLCICLICVAQLLHSMLHGEMAKVIKKTINADYPGLSRHLTDYLTSLVGSGMIMVVKSSSVLPSVLKPHIRVDAVTIKREFLFILVSKIGPTAAGILAALASSSNLNEALQIAFCHLFFNISAITLWYHIPCLQQFAIYSAKTLGNKTADNWWFAVAYLIIVFFLLPAAVFGLSLIGWKILLGVSIPFILLFLFVVIINIHPPRAPGHLPEV
ncbi:Sodium-dependent phosphate transport protein 2B [Acropora cervicornis]|uniref:Sodium-dependent phosphate transport protein 2B n=1 Tax=Acropora cervicornis TaxID=6130 RepID=A0AAD9UW99_ACRCE|nr:Sodium-dependent phosphate transport protein 2B [Acropora cervicornis]